MYITDIIRRSGRSLRHAKARTLLTALAIAVGTFALTLTLAASNGAQSFVDKVISDNFDPAQLIVAKDQTIFGNANTSKPREYSENFSGGSSNAGPKIQIELINDTDIAKIKKISGVETVREAIDVNIKYVTRAGQKKYIATISVFNSFQKPEVLAGKIPSPLNNKQLLLPEGFLEALDFKTASDAIGKQVTLAVRKPLDTEALNKLVQSGQVIDQATIDKASLASTTEEIFTIAAVLKKPITSQPGTELYMFIGLDDARQINDMSTTNTNNYHRYQYLFVNVKNGRDVAKLTTVQNEIKSLGYSAQSAKDTQAFLTQIISVLKGIVAAFGMIAVIASVFGIVNTMYISVLQRTREIGLMKALGMCRRDIGRLFRFEAAWIGFLGGMIGSLLAVGLGFILNPWITKKLQLGTDDLLIFKPSQIVILIAILMLVATLAGLLPARKASKLDPIEALRTE